MLVHPLMKLARSLKTNSPANCFRIFLRAAPCLQTLLDSSSLSSFFPNGLNFYYQNRPTTARNRVKVGCLHIVGGVYQSRLQITIIAMPL